MRLAIVAFALIALTGAWYAQDDNGGGDNAASEQPGQSISEPSGAADPLLDAFSAACTSDKASQAFSMPG
jgi:hypothetical protein